jgi:hypothetical protein
MVAGGENSAVMVSAGMGGADAVCAVIAIDNNIAGIAMPPLVIP